MPHAITDDGVRLHYVVDDYRDPWCGEPAVTVLLHHGFVKNLEHWTPFVPHVARRHRVVRFDVRGAGRSSDPGAQTPWTLERLAADASSVLDTLGIGKVHWAGFESGGTLGMYYAAHHPQRVASLACFNTPYRDPATKSTMGAFFTRGHASPSAAIDAMGYANWIAALIDDGVLVDRDDSATVEWVRQQALAIPAHVAKAWHRVFWDASGLLADLPERIAAPVLLAAGAKHVHGCEPPLLDRLAARLAHAHEVVYVPGVAIGVQLLAPEACAAAYLAFLDDVARERV